MDKNFLGNTRFGLVKIDTSFPWKDACFTVKFVDFCSDKQGIYNAVTASSICYIGYLSINPTKLGRVRKPTWVDFCKYIVASRMEKEIYK